MADNPIFDRLIKNGCAHEDGARVWRVDDSKLWYLMPEQARGYLEYLNEEGYKGGLKEMGLLRKHAAEIVSGLADGPLNIVDLGCGDGRKAVPIIEHLYGKCAIRYCPIDISRFMVDRAAEAVGKLGIAAVKETWSVHDFERLEELSPHLRSGGFDRCMFMLMGNTVGNFETHKILGEIAEGMRERDALIVGSGLDNGKLGEEAISQLKRSKVSECFFSHVPAQLGLDLADLEYDVKFRNSRLDFYYKINADRSVSHGDKRIDFKKGDQLVVAFCYHYKIEEFGENLNRHFTDVRIYPTEDGSYTLARCEK
ncbi:MAG: L-histidine N(alpha)-methyltransferase [Candidatus Aenigmatarchaeota archaeon]